MRENFKRYLISSGVTFLATFAFFAVPPLLDGNFTWTAPAVIAILISAIRLGVKAVWELLLPLVIKKMGKKK